jgi:hypothetical protein
VWHVLGRPDARVAEVVPATLLAVMTATAMATNANATVNLLMLYVPPFVG